MTKVNKSWENESTKCELHSPDGVATLRKNIKAGLTKKYYGIAQTMFRWDGMDDERFADMNMMCQNTEPEHFLFENGQCTAFQEGDSLHILPLVMQGGLNMYGKPNQWRPVPVGWDDTKKSMMPKSWQVIYGKLLNHENSVYMKNDIFGGNDKAYIDSMVDMLVDNMMTTNQLQLLAKMPYVFNVTQDQYLTAKNYYLALSQDAAVIFKSKMSDDVTPVIERADVTIDPAVFEIFDRVECQILEYLGFPCVPITKRAQQSVSETESNSDKIYMRRQEKLRQREVAADRMNELFGTNITVVSVIDEAAEEAMNELAESEGDSGALRSGSGESTDEGSS